MERVRRFFRRGETSVRQALPTHQVANQLREAWLDMFYFGVTGSDKPIPNEPSREATRLPSILHYSDRTSTHFQRLADILRVPREFKITETPNGEWRDVIPDGDVIYRKEDDKDLYYFPHELSSPYLNPVAAVLDKLYGDDAYLDVSLMRKPSEVWNMTYYLGFWGRTNIFEPDYPEVIYQRDNRGFGGNGSLVHPERAFLLEYIFSGQKLPASWFVENGYPPYTTRYLSAQSEEKVGKFRVINLAFNAEAMAAALRKKDHLDPRPGVIHTNNSAEIHALEKDGNREYSIVELGSVRIGNLSYHVYSGAEQPLVKEREFRPVSKPQTVPNPFRQPVFAFGVHSSLF